MPIDEAKIEALLAAIRALPVPPPVNRVVDDVMERAARAVRLDLPLDGLSNHRATCAALGIACSCEPRRFRGVRRYAAA